MRIIIATDGSAYSRAAIEKCCRMVVRPADTAIKIISVYDSPAAMAAEPFAVSAEYFNDLRTAAQRQAEEFVRQAAEMIRNCFHGETVDLSIEVRMGAAAREIVETAQDWKADLIVVGSHGRGFWGRMMLGSVSDSIIHHAPCSVLVVRRAVSPEDE